MRAKEINAGGSPTFDGETTSVPLGDILKLLNGPGRGFYSSTCVELLCDHDYVYVMSIVTGARRSKMNSTEIRVE